MKLLAFDTSTEALSVAVGLWHADGRLQLWQHSGIGGAQASATLIPQALALLADAGHNLSDVAGLFSDLYPDYPPLDAGAEPLPDDVRRVIQRAEAREEGHEEPADGVIDTTATERREGEGGTSLDDLLDMHDGEEVFDDELEGDGEGQPEEGSEAPTEAG